MELTGKVIAIMEAKGGVSARTGNSWMTQEYVIEVPGQYPRKCVFSIFGEDRIKQFNIQAGEDITVQFDIDAHEYNGRWFNEVRAYNVLRSNQQGAVPAATTAAPQAAAPTAAPAPAATPAHGQQPAQNPFPPAAPEAEGGEGSDDLPF